MALLTAAQKDEVRAELMSDWSRDRTETPVSKPQLSALLNIVDGELETAEAAIGAAIPAGPGKTWLVANLDISRGIVEAIQKKRKEVL